LGSLGLKGEIEMADKIEEAVSMMIENLKWRFYGTEDKVTEDGVEAMRDCFSEDLEKLAAIEDPYEKEQFSYQLTDYVIEFFKGCEKDYPPTFYT
jgi:hypothetical protein